MNILSVIIVLLILFICWQTYNKIYSFLNNRFNKQQIMPIQQVRQNGKNNLMENQIKNSILKKTTDKVHKHKPQKSTFGYKKTKKVKFSLPKKSELTKNNLVFMDIGTDSKYYGKIVIELFDKIVPKTCNNFRELCKTKKYFNSPFHRIVKDFMIQGGDFTKGNGTGGMSIYGSKFPDENFKLCHDKPYLLSMANSGPNTNGSQFFITIEEQPHLDGKHVVFGEVKSGKNIIDDLNNVETNQSDKPIENIKILNCGIYKQTDEPNGKKILAYR